jgi:hypothetical protein
MIVGALSASHQHCLRYPKSISVSLKSYEKSSKWGKSGLAKPYYSIVWMAGTSRLSLTDDGQVLWIGIPKGQFRGEGREGATSRGAGMPLIVGH